MSIEAVLLDVGGVFVLPEVDVLLPAVRAAGAPEATAEALARGHYAGIAAMDAAAYTRGISADWPGYFAALAGELGDLADVAAVRAALADAYQGLPWTTILPGTIESLRALADAGVALGIVSNSNGTVQEQLLRQKICQVGEGEGVPVVAVLDSAVIGVEKPHPAIFEHALVLLGVAPSDAIHVGDTGWADVAGARSAGVRPVHVDPYGWCPQPGDHEHVRSLAGVVDLVVAERAREKG